MRDCSPATRAERVWKLVPRAIFAIVIVIGAIPSVALAQATDSKWGVSVSFTPSWKALSDLQREHFIEGEGTIEGTEFTIGLVRGSTLGGDWGVSFVHKPIKDVTFSESTQDCQPQFGCTTSTMTQTLRDVLLKGVEYHWSKPFATFADRVQVGLNVGGGVAFVSGTIDTTFDLINPPPFPVFHQEFSDPASDTLWPVYPLIKVEAQGAVIVAPGLKVKVAGGFNYPSASLRIGVVYLIGG
jgi:hypothetical protein